MQLFVPAADLQDALDTLKQSKAISIFPHMIHETNDYAGTQFCVDDVTRDALEGYIKSNPHHLVKNSRQTSFTELGLSHVT